MVFVISRAVAAAAAITGWVLVLVVLVVLAGVAVAAPEFNTMALMVAPPLQTLAVAAVEPLHRKSARLEATVDLASLCFAT